MARTPGSRVLRSADTRRIFQQCPTRSRHPPFLYEPCLHRSNT